MPSRREVRKRLPGAYRKAAYLVRDFIRDRAVGVEYKEALEQVAKSLEEKAERLARKAMVSR